MAEHFWPLLLVVLVALLLMVGSSGIQGAVDRDGSMAVRFLVDVAVFIFQAFISLGLMRVYLALADGKKRPRVRDLFLSGSFLWRYIGASLVYLLIVLGGLILFIVPGIVWAIKYRLYGYFILDKNARAMESIRLAGRATAGAKWNLFLLILLVGLINLAGIMVLGVGILVSVPVGGIAIAYAYRVLEKRIVREKSHAPDRVPAAA